MKQENEQRDRLGLLLKEKIKIDSIYSVLAGVNMLLNAIPEKSQNLFMKNTFA